MNEEELKKFEEKFGKNKLLQQSVGGVLYEVNQVVTTFIDSLLDERNRELINAYEEYISLLSKEIDKLISMNIAHGWQGDDEAFRKGEELRNKITEFKGNNK